MKHRVIKVCGKEVGVAYCMATEQAFEELTSKSIRELDANKGLDLLLLCLAASIAYDQRHKKDSGLTLDDLMFEAAPAEITSLVAAVAELRNEWYEVPNTLPNDAKPEEEEDAPKN